MKKILKRVGLGVVIAFVVLIVIAILVPSQDFALKTNYLVLEYGDTLPKSFDDFIETDGDKKNIDYSSKDIDDFNKILQVGTYSIDFVSGSKTETLNVEVKDTKAPELTLKQEVSILQNNKIDYRQYVDIQDKSKYEVLIDDDQVNYSKPGNYQAKMIVQDEYKNQSSIDIPICIKEVRIVPSTTSIKLDKNGSQTLKVETNSSNAVVYKSNDESIATVDNQGNIKALKAGVVIIDATVDGKTTSCRVTVNDRDKVKKSSSQNNTTSKSNSSSNKSSASKNSTSKTDNTSSTVYITKTGGKYHRGGCRYLRRSQIAISKKDAINRGYEPCSVCF